MIELEMGSIAYGALWLALDMPDTYLVRIDARHDGVAIKRNEGTWSPTLPCKARPDAPPEQPRSFIETVTKDMADVRLLDGTSED